MRSNEAISIDAPAKINLGLEILGKRADGFHEIRTVMAMLDLSDTVTVFPTDDPRGFRVGDVEPRDNLVTRALAAIHDAVPGSATLDWTLDKRIPFAAGLGGASADAAAALLAANEVLGQPLTHESLSDIAAGLGSDIPFFLGSPFALARDRGIELESISPSEFEILLVVPHVQIPNKTATLYSLVQPPDYTDGTRVSRVVASLNRNVPPRTESLGNVFRRPLVEVIPRLASLWTTLGELDCEAFGLSGAGPAHYLIVTGDQSKNAQDTLADAFGDWLAIIPTRTRANQLAPANAVPNG